MNTKSKTETNLASGQAGPRESTEWWWIAINGASCAACSAPAPESVVVAPVPEQLIGFKTRDEQLESQRFLLTAPISDVAKYMEALPARIRRKEVYYMRPNNPQPPTEGPTIWGISQAGA